MTEPICPDCGYFGSSQHVCGETNSPHAKIIDFPSAAKYAEPTNVVPATESRTVEPSVLPLRQRPVVGSGVESTASAGTTTPKPLSLEHLAQVLLQQQNALAEAWRVVQGQERRLNTQASTLLDLQRQLDEQAAALSQLAGQVTQT